MMVWGASIEVVVLILVMAVAVFHGWHTEIRRSGRTRRLIDWVRSNHPSVWEAQHWTNRHINRLGALHRIRREKMIEDPHFEAEMRMIQPDWRQIGIIFSVASLALVLIAVGVRYWGWQW